MARLARRAGADARAGARAPGVRDAARGGGRRRRPDGDGRVEPGARGDAPVLRRGALSRPRHDAPDCDPAARGPDRRRPDALRSRLEVGDDARDALPRRLLPQTGWAVRSRHRPRLAAGRARRRRLLRRADDRRALLGAVRVRAAAGGADGRRRRAPARSRRGDARGLPQLGGQSGAGPRSLARRAAVPPGGRGLRALGRAARRRVDRQGGEGNRPGAGRRRGARDPASRPLRARPGVLPLGVRDGGRRLDPRHQPLRPAGRPGREGQDQCRPFGPRAE